MTAIADGVDALFSDENVATDATYTPPGGGVAVECRVIVDNADRLVQFGQGRGLAEGRVIKVRSSEIVSVVRGGLFAVGTEDLKIVDDPQLLDPERLIWTCRVEASA
jgi:hypothetical protein